MYAQAAVKQNALLRNGAYGIVMRGGQKCTCAGASLRSKNYTPLNCITIDAATIGSENVHRNMLSDDHTKSLIREKEKSYVRKEYCHSCGKKTITKPSKT